MMRRFPLSWDQYDKLVQRWNTRTSARRKAVARRCSLDGHAYVVPPFSQDGSIQVCRHCLSYIRAARDGGASA